MKCPNIKHYYVSVRWRIIVDRNDKVDEMRKERALVVATPKDENLVSVVVLVTIWKTEGGVSGSSGQFRFEIYKCPR